MSNREEADYVLGTVYSMKGQEAEDYVQLAGDFDHADLPKGAWFKPWRPAGYDLKSGYSKDADARLLFTAVSKARLGLFCNEPLARKVKGVDASVIGVQVRGVRV